jgi:catechol 2,3-dioxygenase-like lactoylglutathione lyase family enzyme
VLSGPTLRVEVFQDDLDRFVDFYVRVLRFELIADRRNEAEPYVALQRGSVRIGALQAWQAVDKSQRALPAGAEFVIEVDDLTAERNAAVAAGYPLDVDVTTRSWGLTDFRLFDPDGHYTRFTTKQ